MKANEQTCECVCVCVCVCGAGYSGWRLSSVLHLFPGVMRDSIPLSLGLWRDGGMLFFFFSSGLDPTGTS